MKQHHDMTRRSFLSGAVKAGAVGLAGSQLAGPYLAAQEQKTMDAWQIGCFTRPWDKEDYRVALDAIAEAGFKHAGLMTAKAKNNLVISVDTTPEEAAAVGAECKQRGLQIPSVYGGGIPVEQSLEAGIAGMKKLIDNCAAAGAENLMMGGIGDEKLFDVYYKAIAESCDYAKEKGLGGISVKPHGGLNATGPQCRKTIETVGHDNFRIWYDPGNIFYYSDATLDPVDDAATVDGLVVGMSVKDYQHPKEVLLTPGTGMVDFPKVMARLKQGGFTGGALVIECLAPGTLPELLEEAKKARAFVENLVAENKV
ncbi:MAG: endonuc 2 protein [Candidatus Hydrogenedentes bacterium]|nr:endonuc 2 protein [Candidatus Hydrogenedentota bacterium]